MATISNTAGGSGAYTLGAITGSVPLFTTPSGANSIFIVYVTVAGNSPGITGINTTKTMIGPDTPYMFGDNSGFIGVVTFNYIQMEIS